MAWAKVDDQIAHHPKILAAGPVASWLWVCSLAYCNKYLTNGFIPTAALVTLGSVPNVQKWAAHLVTVGLWELVDGGYRVHDFHDHNPTAADVRQKRTDERERLRQLRTRDPPRTKHVRPYNARTQT